MTPKGQKIVGIIIAALSMATAAVASIEGLISPTWALVVSTIVAGGYGVIRALQKVASGTPLASLFTSTEAWGSALVILAAIASAVSGVVPVSYATGLVAFSAILVKFGRILQGTLGQFSGAPVNQPAVQAAKAAAGTGPTLPPPATGTRLGTGYPPGPKAAAVLILGASLLLAGAARAQTPAPSQQFGGCFAQGQVCLGPSASITLGELNLATSKFSGGIIPGVGYGATYAQDQWYATGLSLYFSFKAGQDGPNQAIPSLVLSFANYVRVGTGVAITETSGPVQTQWLLLFGLGSDFGGSPKYQQTQLKASMGGK